MLRTRLFTTALIAMVVLVAGCNKGEPKVLIKGRLLQNGTAYQLPNKNLPPGEPGIRVAFVALGADGKLGEARDVDYNKDDGTFTLGDGKKSPGLKPGTYRIAVTFGAFVMGPKVEGFTKESSPLEVTIPEGKEATVVVDIGTKTAKVE